MRAGLWVVVVAAWTATGCHIVFALDDRVDAPRPARKLAHLPAEIVVGERDISIGVTTLIDTTARSITPPLSDTMLVEVAQDRAGPTVVVLAGRDVVIAATVKVVGEHPLVIVGRRIALESGALIDGSADLATGGPGSQRHGATGAGQPGVEVDGGFTVSGGGGGGFFTNAGRGGDASASSCPGHVLGGVAGADFFDVGLEFFE